MSESHTDWPFPNDPPNVAVIATREIVDGSQWIALVSLDEEDGDWQFIGPGGAQMDEAMVVALSTVFERDPSIANLADLPLGWKAWRDGPGTPGQRGPR